MALISCTECGKNISDKAVACPGCGCPVEKVQEQAVVEVDYSNLNAEQLWQLAYDLHYKNSDTQNAIALYQKLIESFPRTTEAGYAKKQLGILNVEVREVVNTTIDTRLTHEIPDSANSSSVSSEGEPWSTSTTIMLGLGTFFMPVLGFLFGIYGLFKDAKRGQGVLLLVIAIVAWLVYGAIFSVIKSVFSGGY